MTTDAAHHDGQDQTITGSTAPAQAPAPENCTCKDQLPGENPICDACQQMHAGVVAELYATDAAFREEMDRWCPVDSDEGQAIMRQLESTA